MVVRVRTSLNWIIALPAVGFAIGGAPVAPGGRDECGLRVSLRRRKDTTNLAEVERLLRAQALILAEIDGMLVGSMISGTVIVSILSHRFALFQVFDEL